MNVSSFKHFSISRRTYFIAENILVYTRLINHVMFNVYVIKIDWN